MTSAQDRNRSELPVFALDGITKRFGALTANESVSFSVHAGEIVALIGENGAGKSTIVNIITGVLRPDQGTITIDGRPVSIDTPRDAMALGIGVVHQHYTLVPTLTVLENIALAMPELGLGSYDRRMLRAKVKQIALDLGFQIATEERVDRLDVAHQQRIEIVKALLREARLLILDEPTAVMGPEDRGHFLTMLEGLRARGVATVLITHKLADVFSACSRAVVLRAGKVVLDEATSKVSPEDLVTAMIATKNAELAAELTGAGDVPPAEHFRSEPLARIEGVTLLRRDGSVALADLECEIRAGEILAIAGVDGNGQAELMRCLAGIEMPSMGRVSLLDVSTGVRGAWTAGRLRAAGLAHVPDDRRRTAIVASLDLARNHLLCHANDPEFISRGVIRFGALSMAVRKVMEEYDVKAQGPQDRMGSLSGGNQQKAVLGRELAASPKVLLVSHPSRGLDVRTTHFIHRRLREVANGGAAIVLVSSDLDEIWRLADRLLVFAAGRAFGPISKSEATVEKVSAWIAGHEIA